MKKIKTNLKCAFCGAESEQEIILSSHVFGGIRHMDARFDNGEVNVKVQTCPNCHYSNFDITAKSKSVQDVMNSSELQTILKSRMDSKAKEYIIAAMVNEKDKKYINAGNLYLAASWVFEDEKNAKKADIYRKLAVSNLIKKVKKDEEGQLVLQCIDLLRKNKDFEQAQKLLDYFKKSTGETLMQAYFEFEMSLTEIVEDENISLLLKIAKFEQKLIKNKDSADHLLNEIKE